MKEFEIEVNARDEELDTVLELLESMLEETGCSMTVMTWISTAVEEVFVNIAHYAYDEGGRIYVKAAVADDPPTVVITFIDKGIPYDPTAKEEPDLSAEAREEQEGGLGIYIVSRIMDEVAYERRGEENILTIRRNLTSEQVDG